VLYFRLNDSFKARMWQQHRAIKDLDVALHEAQSRWIRVDRARKSVPNNNGEFAARVAALKQRIDALYVRLAENEERVTGYLAQLAVHELEEQKGRLAAYQVQARFALATMYDRAANEESPKKEPGAAVPKSMSPEDQKSASPEDQGAAPTPKLNAIPPGQGDAPPPGQGASPQNQSGAPAPEGAAPEQNAAPPTEGAAPTSPPPGTDAGTTGTPKQ
jgi:hypothetical protein